MHWKFIYALLKKYVNSKISDISESLTISADSDSGLTIENSTIKIQAATQEDIISRSSECKPIVPSNLVQAVISTTIHSMDDLNSIDGESGTIDYFLPPSVYLCNELLAESTSAIMSNVNSMVNSKIDQSLTSGLSNCIKTDETYGIDGYSCTWNSLLNDVYTLTSTITEVETNVATLNSSMITMNSDLSDISTEINELTTDLTNTNATVNDINTSISTILTDINSITSNLDNRAEKTSVITNASGAVTLEHNCEYRILSDTIELSLPTNVPDDYISSVVFTSGETATNITYPNTIKLSGEDCEDGIFAPVSNKRYTIIIWYDGENTVGIIHGYEVTV